MNRQGLWFFTLFSLILVLGVYYVTMPNQLLEKVEEIKEEKDKDTDKEVVVDIKEDDVLSVMRINLEEERKEELEVIKEQLIDDSLSVDEKNNLYEQLKYLNEIQGREENIEKKIKKDIGLDCFIKIKNTDVSVVCIADEHNPSLANSIMRLVQNEYKDKMNIKVKFQKK